MHDDKLLRCRLLERVPDGQRVAVVSSHRRRATVAAALALPAQPTTVDPLVAEYDYGDYEGLIGEQICRLAPDWGIWRDGCPAGESTVDVGRRAGAFLHASAEYGTQPVVVVTLGHFCRVLAARALGLASEYGRLFAIATAAVSLIEDHDGERCVGLWSADPALFADTEGRTAHQVGPDPIRCSRLPGCHEQASRVARDLAEPWPAVGAAQVPSVDESLLFEKLSQVSQMLA